jgi:hypothetical protein
MSQSDSPGLTVITAACGCAGGGRDELGRFSGPGVCGGASGSVEGTGACVVAVEVTARTVLGQLTGAVAGNGVMVRAWLGEARSVGHPIAGATTLGEAFVVDGLVTPSASAGTGPNVRASPAAPTTIRRTATGRAHRLILAPTRPTRPGMTEASNASSPSAIQHAASQSKALVTVMAAASTPTRLSHARGVLKSRASTSQSGMKLVKTKASAVITNTVMGRNRCSFT